MNNRMLLDIDDTILTKNLILPENVRDRETVNTTNQFDSKPFFIIQPTPGACIKTKTDTGEKVFLNICTSDKIPPPEDISDAKLFEILSEEAPSFSIPMSIGSERLESDKGGSPCITYDIAINTTYFEKCQNKKSFWLFTISVIMDGVSNKFNKTLNAEEYVVLKNKKVMGKLQQHRIENREPRKQPQVPKPLIEEIRSPSENIRKSRNESKPLENKAPSQSVDDSKLNYVLLRQPVEGTPTRLIGLFRMPKNITGEDIAVLLNPDRVVVTVDKTSLTYDVSIPYVVKPESAKCFLDKDIKVLRINMLVENAPSNILS